MKKLSSDASFFDIVQATGTLSKKFPNKYSISLFNQKSTILIFSTPRTTYTFASCETGLYDPKSIEEINTLIDNVTHLTDDTWDHRALRLALGEVNTWSKDPSTKVSAVIMRGKSPIAVSYNGFPPGIEDTEERLSNRELKYKLIQHAEANAISTCAKMGIATEGTTMAVSHFPCSSCAGMMIGAGIKKVIVQKPTPEFEARWKESQDLSRAMFEEAGIEVVVLDVLNNG